MAFVTAPSLLLPSTSCPPLNTMSVGSPYTCRPQGATKPRQGRRP
jgi:hypothetical protein